MKPTLSGLFAVSILTLLASCTSTTTETSAWGDIDPDDTYHLGEGSEVKVSHSGVQRAHLRVEGGHLWLNGEDLGAYDRSQAIEFQRDGRLTVDGETRGQIPAH